MWAWYHAPPGRHRATRIAEPAAPSASRWVRCTQHDAVIMKNDPDEEDEREDGLMDSEMNEDDLGVSDDNWACGTLEVDS